MRACSLGIGALCVLLCGSVASAATVTYSTTGTFDSNSLAAITVGGITVTYVPQLPTTLTPVPPTTFSDLGEFLTSGVSSGATFSEDFTLVISQTSPSSTTGTFTATVAGTIATSSGGLSVTFDQSAVVLGDVTYRLLNNPMFLNVPSAGVASDVRAEVTVVPLPAAAWSGLGLLGVLGAARIRKARKA